MSLQNKLCSRVFIWRYNIKYLIWKPVSQLLKAPYYAQFTNAISMPVYLSSSQEALKRGRSSEASLWTGGKNWMFFGVCSKQRVEYRSAALLENRLKMNDFVLCFCTCSSVRPLGAPPARVSGPLQKAFFAFGDLREPAVLQASQDCWEAFCRGAGRRPRQHTPLPSDVPRTTEAQLPASH